MLYHTDTDFGAVRPGCSLWVSNLSKYDPSRLQEAIHIGTTCMVAGSWVAILVVENMRDVVAVRTAFETEAAERKQKQAEAKADADVPVHKKPFLFDLRFTDITIRTKATLG